MRFLLGMISATLCMLPAHAGKTLDRVQRSGVLNEVLISEYPPFGFIDANNELAGFDVDVARAVAAKLGVKLKLSTPGWETIVSGRWQGRWDICICSMSPTAARARVLSFPAVYYHSPAVLVVHNKEQRIRSVADLTDKRVGVGMGSSYENFMNKTLVIAGAAPMTFPFGNVTVIPGDETVNFRNLALGPGVRLDAIVANFATAAANISATKALKVVGKPVYAEPNVVATEKGDPEWDQTIARVIAGLKTDGTLSRISRQWFRTDITRDVP